MPPKRSNYTIDEKYILCLHEQAEKSGELDTPLNRYEIGRLIGLQERGVNATCKLLIQANFIKKSSEHDIYLTPHGAALAERLKNEIWT